MPVSLEWRVDLVRPPLTRQAVYPILGRFFISGGIILGCFAGIHLARVWLDGRMAQQSSTLVIADTPVFDLPPATPMPTPTPTATPTLPPPPLPAIRLSIPSIHLNSNIVELSPVDQAGPASGTTSVWEPAAQAVGHYDTSGNPGGGRNIVLSGHNNTMGEVFRNLNQLHLDDEVFLFTETGEFPYRVQKKFIIPYLGSEQEGEATLQSLTSPQSSEMVTLVSCWPYYSNVDRIIIIAVPVPGGG